MNSASEIDNHIPGEQTGRSRKYAKIVLVLTLMLGIGILTTLQVLASDTSAQAQPMLQNRSPGALSEPGASRVLSTPGCDPNWDAVSSPNGDGSYLNYLLGVAVVSSDDVWAVGSYSNDTAYRTLTEHWNGSSWSVAPSPNVDGNANYLLGVAVVSSDNVWAAGYYFTGSLSETLIEHWDGSAWSIVPSPNVGTFSNALSAVDTVSSDDVWAAGYIQNNSNIGQTLIEHWDGSAWSIVPSPNGGASRNYLLGITAVSSNDVWAVGQYYNDIGMQRTLIEHWNGSAWSVILSPNVGTDNNSLNGVAAISSSDVWTVGAYCDTNNNCGTLVEHWNGIEWTVVPSPYAWGTLTAVAATSSDDVWAVGFYWTGTVERTLVLRWDGSAWSVVSSPNVGTLINNLLGVAVVSSGDVWAVGFYQNHGLYRTLVERYNPCPYSPTPASTPTATSCPIQFSDVPPGSTFYPYVHDLACLGIVSGYSDGTFRPNASVTRGQLSKIVSNSAGFSDPQTTQMFQDVPLGSTFQVYVGRLASRGYISGYPCGGGPGEPCVPPANLPYFRPNANATRGQIAKIVSNAAGFGDPPNGQQFQDVPLGSTYYTYTYRLAGRAIVSGYPCGSPGEPCMPPDNLPYFRPDSNASRGQTAKIVQISSAHPTPGPTATNTPNPACQGIPPSSYMQISPGDCEYAGTRFTFVGSGFEPNESAGVYLTDPGGQVYGAPFQLQVDGNGYTAPVSFTTNLSSTTGQWALHMEGLTSHHQAIGYFRLLSP